MAEKYVDGQIHTNGIEKFWRSSKARHQGNICIGRTVSPVPLSWMSRLLDSTHARGEDADRFVQTVKQIAGKRLTFDELTGKKTSH